ncbi:hypothetical protein [Mesorhizobium sp. KR9-304]|uniref:hypothetical protein n=1 Tax=Mesorhizobium sp. KR9-304 TaxID=3156614 RepID=UPI0032B4093C
MRTPFEPHVVTLERPQELVHVLVSSAFDTVASPDELMSVAVPLIGILNGVMAVQCGAKSLSFYGAVELLPDGNFRRHLRLFAEQGRFEISGFPASLAHCGTDRQPIVALTPSTTQNAIAMAKGDLADALTYFARAYDWQELWKAFETIGAHYGSTQDAAYLQLGASQQELARFRATANEIHRHHKWRSPPRPSRVGATSRPSMTLQEGKVFVAALLKASLQ